MMKKSLILACVLLTLGFAPGALGQKIRKETIESQGKTRTYYLVIPSQVTADHPAPLLVLLHGSGRNGLSLVEKWKDLANKEGIIIAGPDAINSQGWSIPADGPEFLHDLISELKAKYPIDPRRMYLFGHSAGAGFALYMSLYESEYFAATAIHAGALPPNDFSLVKLAKRKIPIYIVVGTVDPFFPLTAVRATRDALNNGGLDVQLTEINGHNHWYYDMAPKINADAWSFLKQQKLAEDPRYNQYAFK
jgi:poly(3-hydroxybutyrate) depolymerase